VDQGFTAWLIDGGEAMEFIDRRARPAMHNSNGTDGGESDQTGMPGQTRGGGSRIVVTMAGYCTW
jgi:hypothetical protein